MLNQSAPADPRVHEAARRMATQFVEIVSAILMENERQEALRQAYFVARTGLERMKEGR